MLFRSPDFEPLQSAALQFIWEKSRLQEDREDAVTMIKWRKLGFETEDIGHEFREVGVLGLDCLVGRLPTPVKGVDAVRMLKCCYRNTSWNGTQITGRRLYRNS